MKVVKTVVEKNDDIFCSLLRECTELLKLIAASSKMTQAKHKQAWICANNLENFDVPGAFSAIALYMHLGRSRVEAYSRALMLLYLVELLFERPESLPHCKEVYPQIDFSERKQAFEEIVKVEIVDIYGCKNLDEAREVAAGLIAKSIYSSCNDILKIAEDAAKQRLVEIEKALLQTTVSLSNVRGTLFEKTKKAENEHSASLSQDNITSSLKF